MLQGAGDGAEVGFERLSEGSLESSWQDLGLKRRDKRLDDVRGDWRRAGDGGVVAEGPRSESALEDQRDGARRALPRHELKKESVGGSHLLGVDKDREGADPAGEERIGVDLGAVTNDLAHWGDKCESA